MKKNRVCLFCGLFFSMAGLSSLELTSDFYRDDPWGFVGKKFYDEPLSNYNTLEKKVLLLVAGVVGTVPGFLSYKISNKFIQRKKTKPLEIEVHRRFDKGKTVKFATTFFLSSGGFAIGYGILNVKMKCRVDYDVLKTFMENWETYKELTPIQLHAVFERVHSLYVSNGWSSIKRYTEVIVREVRKKLARNDESYGALYKINEDFFEAKHFVLMLDINIYELLKASWDIFLASQIL